MDLFALWVLFHFSIMASHNNEHKEQDDPVNYLGSTGYLKALGDIRQTDQDERADGSRPTERILDGLTRMRYTTEQICNPWRMYGPERN